MPLEIRARPGMILGGRSGEGAVERVRRVIDRHDVLLSWLLVIAVLAVAAHQYLTSASGVLTAWKGGGFGMYTTPHGTTARATFLVVDGNPLRLAPADPAFAAWAESVDPASATYLDGLVDQAEAMRAFPRDAAADRLMRAAARVVWDKDLFGTWTDVGQQPATAMSVVVIEVARRPSSGVIDSRVVFDRAGG